MGLGNRPWEPLPGRVATRPVAILVATALGPSGGGRGARSGGANDGGDPDEGGRVYLEGYHCGGIAGRACPPASDCAGEEYCSSAPFDVGIRVPVERAPASACAAWNDRPWPYECRAGECRLFCSGIYETCPTGRGCVDLGCSPP